MDETIIDYGENAELHKRFLEWKGEKELSLETTLLYIKDKETKAKFIVCYG